VSRYGAKVVYYELYWNNKRKFISHRLVWDRTQASAAGYRQLTVFAIVTYSNKMDHKHRYTCILCMKCHFESQYGIDI
jgi:NAD-dependent dihydropyrimidine dehydrogenase PreA subunit